MRWTRPGFGSAAFLVAVCTYVVELLFTAPATLADAALSRASEGRLRLAEASGTLWSGTGKLEILDARRQTGFAKALAWRLQPASLLKGRFDFEFRMDDSPFTVAILMSRLEATDVHANLPAAALGLIVPRIAPLEPTGDLVLRASNLSISKSAVYGKATLLWRSAGSALTPVSPLGDYELNAEAEGTSAKAVLRTIQGIVQLEGQGSWLREGAPSLLLTARVASQYREQLQPLLRLVAVDRGDGSFELRVR